MTTNNVSGEVTQEHTRLLRMGLAEPESREYWRHSGRQIDPTQRIQIAFEERWFGSRAMARVQYLIQNFQARFDAYPSALKTLHRWNSEDLAERRLLCHWHLQLSDPIYRSFTSTHLLERLHHPQPTLDRNAALRWVEGQGRWAAVWPPPTSATWSTSVCSRRTPSAKRPCAPCIKSMEPRCASLAMAATS